MMKTNHCRASQLWDITDKWAAYQFDSAVTLVGISIENALQETVKVGSKDNQSIEPKYKLGDILKDDFRFPRELTEKEKQQKALDWYRNMIGRGAKWVKAKQSDADVDTNELLN